MNRREVFALAPAALIGGWYVLQEVCRVEKHHKEVQQEHCTFLDAVKKADENRGKWWRRRSIPIREFHICLPPSRTIQMRVTLCVDDFLANDWEPAPE